MTGLDPNDYLRNVCIIDLATINLEKNPWLKIPLSWEFLMKNNKQTRQSRNKIVPYNKSENMMNLIHTIINDSRNVFKA